MAEKTNDVCVGNHPLVFFLFNLSYELKQAKKG
jgi:hypothetical protein